MKKLILAGALFCTSFAAQAAQINVSVGDSQTLNVIMRKVEQLERKNMQLTERVRNLEDAVFGGSGQLPGGKVGVACSVRNSVTGETHLGKGPTRLDAEFLAKQSCKAGQFKLNCDDTSLKCEDEILGSSITCIANNTVSGNIFRANAATKIEASALALKACTSENFKLNCTISQCSQ